MKAITAWALELMFQTPDPEPADLEMALAVYDHNFDAQMGLLDGPKLGMRPCFPEGRPRPIERARRIPIGPDCRDGKHPACDGRAFDGELDDVVDCACSCHLPEAA